MQKNGIPESQESHTERIATSLGVVLGATVCAMRTNGDSEQYVLEYVREALRTYNMANTLITETERLRKEKTSVNVESMEK